MYHVPLAVGSIYGGSDEGGEDRDGKEGCKIPDGWERLEIASCMQMTWLHVLRRRRT